MKFLLPLLIAFAMINTANAKSAAKEEKPHSNILDVADCMNKAEDQSLKTLGDQVLLEECTELGLSVDQYITISLHAHSPSTADEIIKKGLDEYAYDITLDECTQLASYINYPNERDLGKIQCLEYVEVLSKDQCRAVVRSMQYDDNKDEARKICAKVD